MIGYALVCDPESDNDYGVGGIIIDAPDQSRGHGRAAMREISGQTCGKQANRNPPRIRSEEPGDILESGLRTPKSFAPLHQLTSEDSRGPTQDYGDNWMAFIGANPYRDDEPLDPGAVDQFLDFVFDGLEGVLLALFGS